MPRTRPEETRDEGKKKKNGVCSNSREYTTNVFVVLYYRVYTDMARRLHTIIIRGVGWAFEQNGGGKNPLAAVSILSAGRIRRSSVLDSSSRKARAV